MSVPAPQFDRFDERVASGLVAASDAAGGLPEYLGLRITEITAGRLVAEAEVRDELLTPFGNLHGGVMAAIVDHVLGCVLYPLIEPGSWAATTEFKLNYLAPVTTGRLVAEATVVSLTRRTAVVRCEVANDGRLTCAAQGTLLVVAPKTAGDGR